MPKPDNVERQGRELPLARVIETPALDLDPGRSPELIVKNLIAEIYDHLTGEFAKSRPSATDSPSGSMIELAEAIVAETEMLRGCACLLIGCQNTEKKCMLKELSAVR